MLNIHRWFQLAYSLDPSQCHYEALHALKNATGGRVYSTIDLLRKVIDRKHKYGNANGKYMTV